jgi:hypothetical protein
MAGSQAAVAFLLPISGTAMVSAADGSRRNALILIKVHCGAGGISFSKLF